MSSLTVKITLLLTKYLKRICGRKKVIVICPYLTLISTDDYLAHLDKRH